MNPKYIPFYLAGLLMLMLYSNVVNQHAFKKVADKIQEQDKRLEALESPSAKTSQGIAKKHGSATQAP